MFPLDNLTRAFTASFSRHISALGRLVVLKGPRSLALLELMFSWGLWLPWQHVVPILLARAQVY